MRKVGSGDDLVAGAEGCHFTANGAGNFAADVGINLVEDHQRSCVLVGKGCFTANMTRLISPDEAIWRSGSSGSPGLGPNWNSIDSSTCRKQYAILKR